MNNTKLNCSLNDTTILRNLILENPELPVLIFCGEEAWDGEHYYSQADVGKAGIEELTLYKDMWVDKEDYRDKLTDDLSDNEDYINMTDSEYDKMIDEKIAETEFVKAIVIWVS